MARYTVSDAPQTGGRYSVSPDDAFDAKIRAEGGTSGSGMENFAAGMGKAVVDAGRGAGQIVRSALPQTVADRLGLPSEQSVQESRQRDAALSKTGAGKAGEVVGNLAMFAPTALIPGANTVTGAGVIGGVMGALRPTVEGESRLKNTAIGATVGAVTQGVAGKVVNKLGSSKAAAGVDAATEQAQNATRDAALKAGQEAGYVVPPATINPGLKNEMVESLGGKIATAQTASLKNQAVTDGLARQYLGMPQDAILSKAALADARNVAAAPYKQIANVSPEAKAALNEWKQANFDSKMQWNYFRKSGNPQAFNDAKAAGDAAESALNRIEAEATKIPGGEGLLDSLKAARVKLAQLHTVESAMTSGGHVDAKLIAKMGERFPLSGELKTVSDFAGNFPKAVQTPEKIGSMSHLLRPGIGAGIGTVLGGPAGTAVGTVAGVAAPWTIRKALLSGVGQRALASPSYGPGAVGTVHDLLANPLLRASLPPAATVAALNNRAQ